jgi:hypothetical protein
MFHMKQFKREYSSWRAMKTRVLNPNFRAYHRYGGRGISIHQPWIESFDAFLADMGRRPEGATLDRIDNDGDYEPENCRWADKFTQARNSTRASLSVIQVVTVSEMRINGSTHQEIANHLNVTRSAISNLLRRQSIYLNRQNLQSIYLDSPRL